MRKMKNTYILLTSLVLLTASLGFSADVDVIASGLTGTDAENAGFSFTPEGYITIMFGERGMFPARSEGTVLADGDVFSGDYAAAGIHKVGFRIRSELQVDGPAVASVILKSGSGRIWRNMNVEVSNQAGLWVANNIELTRAAGWARDGPGNSELLWDIDIKDVVNIGIRLAQVGSQAQNYSIGTFVLLDSSGKVVGESGLMPSRVMDYFASTYEISDTNDITDEMKATDSDNDGMNDWLELLAGTDPEDSNSIFVAKIVDFAEDGITVSWPCVSDGMYKVMRREGFGSEFGVITVDLTPTESYITNGVMMMEHKDSFAPGRGPYMYKIVKQ
jgi:hypothetical protein